MKTQLHFQTFGAVPENCMLEFEGSIQGGTIQVYRQERTGEWHVVDYADKHGYLQDALMRVMSGNARPTLNPHKPKRYIKKR